MSKSKNKRDTVRRRQKQARPATKGPRGQSVSTNARFVAPDLQREIRHIVRCAQAEDSRVASLGNFVLFSTGMRDAWLLDSEDKFALCLCRDGDPQPTRIIETADTFAVERTAPFAIDQGAFVVHEKSGRIVTNRGYPTVEISAACRANR